MLVISPLAPLLPSLHSKHFRGTGEQRKTKERNRNSINSLLQNPTETLATQATSFLTPHTPGLLTHNEAKNLRL